MNELPSVRKEYEIVFYCSDAVRGSDAPQLAKDLPEQLHALARQSEYAPACGLLEEFVRDVFLSEQNSSSEKKILGLLFDSENVIRGFVQVRFFAESADLDFIIVDTTSRRQGFAGLLLSAMESELTARNVSRVLLEVGDKNLSAQKLYVRFHYQKIAVRKAYYKSGEDAVVMEKPL